MFSFLRRQSAKPTPPPPTSDKHHFHLIAQLQLAVHDASLLASSDLMSGSNDPNLRRQGKLCFTFATRNHPFSNEDRLRVADDLERAVDAAYCGEDYRRRVYDVGGWVSGNESLVRDLVEKRVLAASVVVADAMGSWGNSCPEKVGIEGDGDVGVQPVRLAMVSAAA